MRRGRRLWSKSRKRSSRVIEEHDDGRFTIFVPSVPTPFAGAVYVLGPERVHIIDVPFTQAIKTITQWGSGSRELVAAMPKKVSTFKPQSRVTG